MARTSAGIAGWTWAGASEIRTLWVHAEHRGRGYGHRLLAMAEQEAVARGCTLISLASYSFQAPEFYQRHGYEIGWYLQDFPPGHRNYYLFKRLVNTAN